MARIKGWVITLVVLAVSFCVITLAGAADLKLLSQGLTKTSYTCSGSLSYEPRGPEKAFDGLLKKDNDAACWVAGPVYPSWLMVDLGENYNIIKTMSYMNSTDVFYQYKIEVSTDKQAWTMFADKTKNQDPSGDPAYTDMGSETGRYVRITLTGVKEPKDWYWAILHEFQVYGIPIAFLQTT